MRLRGAGSGRWVRACERPSHACSTESQATLDSSGATATANTTGGKTECAGFSQCSPWPVWLRSQR